MMHIARNIDNGKARQVNSKLNSRVSKETLIYHLKLAHKAWMSKVVLHDIHPTPEINELVWELLLAYANSVDDFGNQKKEMFKIAYELANTLLDDISIEVIRDVFRDGLLDAMMRFIALDNEELSQSMIRCASVISSAFCEAHSDSLKREIRQKTAQSVSNELQLAKRIQQHLLPLSVPTVEGFDFAGRLMPATEIGGDYYSIKHQPDGRVTMKLADITGHGVAAATLVAAVKFISGGYYQGAVSASEVMNKTNRVLVQDTPHEILVSMVYGWLRPDTHELTLVNAGLESVFWCNGDECRDIAPTGPVMGFEENASYTEVSMKLAKGDIIFFGSDGILEAGVGEQFGQARLKNIVLSNSHLSADEIADTVLNAVHDFANHKPHDDCSLVVAKVDSDPPDFSAKGI